MTETTYRLFLVLLAEEKYVQAELCNRLNVFKVTVSSTSKRLYEELKIVDCRIVDGKRIYFSRKDWLEKAENYDEEYERKLENEAKKKMG